MQLHVADVRRVVAGDLQDRRAYLLTLTRKGAAVLGKARQLVEPLGVAFTTPIGAEVHRLLLKLLDG